ncbi:hypothetical protein SERLA73DRAFT_52897 [Serpula lacrymans var. lacrymans S7.3]|uniref:NAD(P)-binding protein n=1 Tax=Serpula lacrymans var. lacrymans (strain S7.3) TaxID=936435 RepID=F8PVI6_SERL3|nr:hypothetical protein SERLA73DRAFT_52897 [Serpula lacrymans var. lacrymans S7.3]
MVKLTKFGFSSTGDEVVQTFPDRVKGKIIVITGPSPGGIGAETAISLAKASPALLLLAGRAESKISPLIQEIQSKYPAVATKFIKLDLGSQASVRSAATEINSSVERIDILINNAAVMVCPYGKTEDGIETQFGTNHIGHFLLTNLLMNKILNAGLGARIVNVSSSAHRSGEMRFNDWNFEDGKVYNEWEAYGQSKTANILFSVALAKKLKNKGIFSYSLHPGFYVTDSILADGLARAVAAEAKAGRVFERAPQKTTQQGCSTTLVAALDPALEGHNGTFLWDGDIAENKPPEGATNEENAERLWKLSEDLVGEKFSIKD